MNKNKKPFYGWAITSMGAFGNAIQGGFIFWSMGMYTSAFEDHFQTSRARVTLIETCITVAANLLFPIVGLWVDKRSARHFVALGAISMGTGLILVSQAGTLVQVWVVYATLIPLGVLALGVLPSSALISRWFQKKRGLSLGISVAGSSLGGFLIPPLIAYLFMAHGWRTALLFVGIGIILTAPVFYFILANYPEDKGLEPLTAETSEDGAKVDTAATEWSFMQLFRARETYLQAAVSGSLLAITLGMLANLSLHAKDLEFTGQQTGLLYSIIAFCSFGGKIAFGLIIDRFGPKLAAALTIILMASSMLVFLSGETYQTVLAASLIVGLGTGGVTPVWTALIAHGFGAESFGRAIGVQNPMHIPITAPSAPIAGYISDVTGSYQNVFVMYLCFTAIASVALFFLRTPVHPDSAAGAP